MAGGVLKTKVLGAEIEYLERGTGSPLLLLHGNPDTKEIWEPVISRLEGRGRCLAPDLPGFGGSEIPASFDFSLPSQAAFVDGFLDAVGVTAPVNLVVHDVGGPYGLAWAVRHPERVRRIVIFNTSYSPHLRWHFWARVWRTPILGEISVLLMNRPLFRREVGRGSPKRSRAEIDAAYARITPRAKRGVLAWYRAMSPEVFVAEAPRLRELTAKVPTRVLWGVHDPYLPDQTLANSFGEAKVRFFPDCGHWVPAEAPEEAAAEILGHIQ